jgi:hypothetical protein
MQTGSGQDEGSHLSAVAQPAKAEAIPIIPCLTDRFAELADETIDQWDA